MIIEGRYPIASILLEREILHMVYRIRASPSLFRRNYLIIPYIIILMIYHSTKV